MRSFAFTARRPGRGHMQQAERLQRRASEYTVPATAHREVVTGRLITERTSISVNAESTFVVHSKGLGAALLVPLPVGHGRRQGTAEVGVPLGRALARAEEAQNRLHRGPEPFAFGVEARHVALNEAHAPAIDRRLAGSANHHRRVDVEAQRHPIVSGDASGVVDGPPDASRGGHKRRGRAADSGPGASSCSELHLGPADHAEQHGDREPLVPHRRRPHADRGHVRFKGRVSCIAAPIRRQQQRHIEVLASSPGRRRRSRGGSAALRPKESVRHAHNGLAVGHRGHSTRAQQPGGVDSGAAEATKPRQPTLKSREALLSNHRIAPGTSAKASSK